MESTTRATTTPDGGTPTGENLDKQTEHTQTVLRPRKAQSSARKWSDDSDAAKRITLG